MRAYILGAGASLSAGYPLASKLLESLSAWLDRCDSTLHWVPGMRNRMIQVRETFGSLGNFEAILGQLEEYGHLRVKPDGPTTYRQDHKDIIHDCMERFRRTVNSDPDTPAEGFYPQYLRSDLISAFREYFYDIEEKQKRRHAYDDFADRKAGRDCSVITFNYDVALERSLARAGKWDVGDGYGYEFLTCRPVSALSVLKLHGSVNWFKSPISEVPPPVMFLRDLALLGCDEPKDPRVAGNGMGVDNSGAFILPDQKKKFYWAAFWEPLWKSASERLRVADEVFIHGYSMPAADARAKQLLFGSIDKSAKISVHCRSTSNRIAEDFCKHGFTAVTSFPDIGFEDWVRG
jgi:hypothetical protein